MARMSRSCGSAPCAVRTCGLSCAPAPRGPLGCIAPCVQVTLCLCPGWRGLCWLWRACWAVGQLYSGNTEACCTCRGAPSRAVWHFELLLGHTELTYDLQNSANERVSTRRFCCVTLLRAVFSPVRSVACLFRTPGWSAQAQLRSAADTLEVSLCGTDGTCLLPVSTAYCKLRSQSYLLLKARLRSTGHSVPALTLVGRVFGTEPLPCGSLA